MHKDSKIYVAGHRGMVGSALVRALRSRGFDHLVVRTHGELDLTRQAEVEAFFAAERPEVVFLAAARVGGIHANDKLSAEFLYDNIMIQANVIDAAQRNGVAKLLALGSSCIYPKLAPQPMREEALLTGPLEPTNEAYSIAKIAGIKLCDMYRKQYGADFISAMPCNLYGRGDNYHPEHSHVLPALIRKIHLVKCVTENNREELERIRCREQKSGQAVAACSMEDWLARSGIALATSQPQRRAILTLWGSGTPRR